MSDNLPIKKYDNYVVCPYDKLHLLLPHRLAVHLERCKRNFPNRKMLTCPFNTTHVLDPKETDLLEHIQTCNSRRTYETFQASPANSNTSPQSSTLANKVLVHSTEDWDAEPATSTYDPTQYCIANNIVRVQYGQTSATRRLFREEERKRLNKKRQAKDSEAKNSASPLDVLVEDCTSKLEEMFSIKKSK